METLTETAPTQIRMGDGTLRSEWLVRLRSGLYRQCRHRLREGDGFCALGVLADILVERGEGSWGENGGFDDGSYASDATLSASRLAQVGLTPAQAARVALINDGGVSLDRIADLVETYV